MTVKELIAKLEALPPNHEVITDLHSEWSAVKAVGLVNGFDNGGYISRPYRAEDKLKVHGYVYIGTSAYTLLEDKD